MKDFFAIPRERIIHQSEYFFIIRDGYPVSPGHSLIISTALKTTYFALNEAELNALPKAIQAAKSLIEQEYSPDGYNIGMNCGETAGQSVMHFHCHLIPRYHGDMERPRGGVRHVIPEKGPY